ncbi:MAG: EamA family transporter [Alphaproteobacteria bacterium]|nr:EamA family transporter [Alphaproteobacteria bacterium]
MGGTAITPLSWALFFFCVAVWGSAYATVRFCLEHGAAPWLIVAARLWLATFALNLFLAWRHSAGKAPPPTPKARRKLFAMGLLGAVIPFGLYAWAQQYAPSGLAGLYSALTPLMVGVLAPLFAAEERLTLNRIIGLSLGFAGVAVLMGPAAFGAAHTTPLLPQLAVAAAAASYAINNLVGRMGASVPAIEAAAGWTFFGALSATPFAIWQTAQHGWPEPLAWVGIAALAIGPTALAAIAFFHLLRTTGPLFVSQTNYLLPVWAIVLGAMWFGETIAGNLIGALALIAAGLFVTQEGWKALRR